MKDKTNRISYLKNIKRIVIKIGSRILTNHNGLSINTIMDLTEEIWELKEKGFQPIIISSGAIASGIKKMGRPIDSSSIPEKQALAAIGQANLVMAYEEGFERFGGQAAQILLTKDDLVNRRRYLNARNTLMTLLKWGVVPIINENDTVVVEEIKVGDNDNLASMIAPLVESDLLIILTDTDGVYDADPRKNSHAKRIPFIEKVDESIIACSSNEPGSLGRGGMASKIMACHKVAITGIPSVVANGRTHRVLSRILKGEDIGTFFKPSEEVMPTRKHWIAFVLESKGRLVIDKGASEMILYHGKSLLPSGIKKIEGSFEQGEAVECIDLEGKRVAVGLVNYPSGDISKIMGLRSEQIEARLGYKYSDEVIHRDNMVIFKDQAVYNSKLE